MPPPPITPHIPQPRNILPQLSPEVVFDLQVRELGVDVDDGLVGEGAEARGGVDVKAREQVAGYLGADTVEGLDCFLRGRGGVLEGLFW